MPPKGYKSVTLPSELYDILCTLYMQEKPALKRKGIRSFSGFISYKLDQLIVESEAKQEKKILA